MWTTFHICFDSSQLKCAQFSAIMATGQRRLSLCTVSARHLVYQDVDDFGWMTLLRSSCFMHHLHYPQASNLQNAEHSKILNKHSWLSWTNRNPQGFCESSGMDFFIKPILDQCTYVLYCTGRPSACRGQRSWQRSNISALSVGEESLSQCRNL